MSLSLERTRASSRSSRLGRRRLTREISRIARVHLIHSSRALTFWIETKEARKRDARGWDVLMGCNYKKKERKKERRTNERLLAIDDDGGDLAKGGEERARARGGRLLRTRLGSNL